MRFSERRDGPGVTARGVTQTDVTRIARHELIQQAVQFLLASAKVDRIGIWMESEGRRRLPGSGFAVFHGIVADRDGETTPPEWESLSPEAPLPLELLNEGKSVEQDLHGAAGETLLGALVEIQKAAWVPVAIRGRLRGVLLAGSRKRHGALPVRLLESVSAELSLAVELDEQRRLAQERQADIAATREFLEGLAKSGPTDAILTQLVESCTDGGVNGEGPGAVFASLRAFEEAGAADFTKGIAEPYSNTSAKVLSWQSGDPAWLHALGSRPFADVCQRAREVHGPVTVWIEAGTVWPRGDVARLVVIGLEAAGESMGVLAAGFRRESTSHPANEGLELRAGLATMALVLRERDREAGRHEDRQQALVQMSTAATILVNGRGAIVAFSGGAQALLGRETGQSGSRVRQGGQTPQAGLIELFHAREQPRVEAWLSHLEASSPGDGGLSDDSPEVELRNGGCVRLSGIRPGGSITAVTLEPLAERSSFQSKPLQMERLAALGQMVTRVAHELSNPLTSILGYAQRLCLRSQAEGQSDEVRQIFQEAERAATIVRQLLMSVRESRPERRKVSLNQLVVRTIDLQKISLAADKVNIELDLDEALPFVIGDAGQLQQVLMNLVGNARQAIELRGKGGTIRLRTKCTSSGRAQLEVSDDGTGIPKAIASRIFDPFFTTKPAGIGTGLGLAIVLGVVREHGGQVKVSSPPEGGAAFYVEFPAAPGDQAVAPAVSATGGANRDLVVLRRSPAASQFSRLAEAPGLSPWSGTRVLVVEDEPTVARLISDVLEDEGFEVDALLDVREALERATPGSYDLVICDMKMPGLDGQHFYETLASTGNPLCKRFLFVTGDVLSSRTHEFLERHHLPHVAKPFRVDELTAKVRGVLADVRPEEALSEMQARSNAATT